MKLLTTVVYLLGISANVLGYYIIYIGLTR